MADGNDMSDKSGEAYGSAEDSDADEPLHPVHLDLGDDLNRSASQDSRLTSSDGPRREDNPFSFKHFLRSDYQNRGARPKVYCEGRPAASVSDLEFPPNKVKQTRVVPEYSSALPDFVQDHLVVEQCYLGGNSANSHFNLDVNLPDFTPSRDSVNINRLNVADSSHNVVTNNSSNDLSIPLDLPVRPPSGFPLDLPATPPTTAAEVGVSKSLPDFLADGAVRPQSSNGASLESPERECDRLRRELEIVRGQLNDQNRRVETLTRELEISRNKERDYTQNLAKALEQVEENLQRSNKRTTNAENTVSKLKQEIKLLTLELNHLRVENRTLRGEEGAAGGHEYAPNEMHSQRLAQELKAAANTAEHSLRQLLTGVDNLRIMAASLENMHRIEERDPYVDFLKFDDDTGPAL